MAFTTSEAAISWWFRILCVCLLATAFVPARAAINAAPEGRVRFYQIADTPFDRYTHSPVTADQEFMRERYFRMQTYSTYFDSRLAWYPNAWVYKDSYAIKPHWRVFRVHPEWVLRDQAGRKLYIDWGCGNGTCPQYAADIGNPEFRRWWIEGARALIERGYAGIWIDDVNMAWRISDGQGERVIPRDSRTGRDMTLADWQRYLADFMAEVRAALPAAEITHNTIWYAGAFDDPLIARQIDAADYINLERGATDKGLRGGRGEWGFERFLEFVDTVHRRGRSVVMMDYGTTTTEREFGLATWFLISRGRDLMSSNQLAWTAPDRWWTGYGLDLGRAHGPRYEWRGVLRRDFDCGMVLLNQPDMPVRRLAPGSGFTDIDGRPAADVTLEGRAAAILRRACLPAPAGDVPAR